MTEKEEKELDEMIDKMAADMKKKMAEREKVIAKWKALENKWKLDEEVNQLLRERLLIDTDINISPFCHIVKPDGQLGREFMIEKTLLRHCIECNDKEYCWNVGQLKDLIEEKGKTLLNQDY